jgi:hypothetical protein
VKGPQEPYDQALENKAFDLLKSADPEPVPMPVPVPNGKPGPDVIVRSGATVRRRKRDADRDGGKTPVKVSKTRDGLKKTAGDGLPVDLAGGMVAEGSIVAVPVVLVDPDNPGEVPGVRLRLGYVRKLGKSFIDVVTFVSATETEQFRCTDPRNELVLVNPELLDSRVPLYESVKFAAATNRGY